MSEPDHIIRSLAALRLAILAARDIDVVVMLGSASPCVRVTKREALAMVSMLADQWGDDAQSIDAAGWAVILDNGERISIGGL